MGLLRGICFFVLAAIGVGLVWNTTQRNRQAGGSIPAAPILHASREQRRPIYRFSVIPGGVLSGAELRQALERDSVAAEHYKGFSLKRTHIEAVPRDRLVYVSYRVGDQVYWTRKRILLSAGESILTDGRQQARTRCGNRIADTPQERHRQEEPDEKAFDTAEEDQSGIAWALSGKENSRDTPFQGGVPGTGADSYLASFGPSLVSGASGSSGAGAGSQIGGGGGGPTGHSPGAELSRNLASQHADLKPMSTDTAAMVSNPAANDFPALFSPVPLALKPDAALTIHTDVPRPFTIPESHANGVTPASTVVPGIEASEANYLFGPATSFPVLSTVQSESFDSHVDLAAFGNRQPGLPRPEATVRNVNRVQVPEPNTWIEGFFGTALLAMGLTIRRRRVAA